MASKIIDTFVSNIDKDRSDYTLDELKRLLTISYKTSKKKRVSTEKKEPSKYNIFIKDEIAKIRQENPDVDKKQLMSLAAARWNDHKQKTASTGSNASNASNGSDSSSINSD